MLCYDRINLSEGTGINKTSVIFVAIGTFATMGLSFNQMLAVGFLMY